MTPELKENTIQEYKEWKKRTSNEHFKVYINDMLDYLENDNEESRDRHKGRCTFYSTKEKRFFKHLTEVAQFYKIGYETLVMKMQRGKSYGIVKM